MSVGSLTSNMASGVELSSPLVSDWWDPEGRSRKGKQTAGKKLWNVMRGQTVCAGVENTRTMS